MENTQTVQQRITSYKFPGNVINGMKQFVIRCRIDLSETENHKNTIEIYFDVNSTVYAINGLLKEIGNKVINGEYIKGWYEIIAEFNIDNPDRTLMSETIFETQFSANVPLYDFL